jgi:hypothetical protein
MAWGRGAITCLSGAARDKKHLIVNVHITLPTLSSDPLIDADWAKNAQEWDEQRVLLEKIRTQVTCGHVPSGLTGSARYFKSLCGPEEKKFACLLAGLIVGKAFVTASGLNLTSAKASVSRRKLQSNHHQLQLLIDIA